MTVVVDPSNIPLVVDEDDIARRIGLIDPPPTVTQVAIIRDAIIDAMDDVQGILGVPIVPTTHEVRLPAYSDFEGYMGDYVRARSPQYTANDDGTVTLSFTYGYDARTDPEMGPVRRYVRYLSMAQPGVIQLWGETSPTDTVRRKKSASTDGQSVTYEYIGPDGRALSEVAKANVPDRSSIDYWRIAGRRIFRREGYGSEPMPIDGFVRSGWYW